MTLQVEHPKWILYRHTSDFTLLCEVAQILKSYSKTNITKAEKERLNLRLREYAESTGKCKITKGV